MASTGEKAFVAPPIQAAGGRVIASPFQFYTTGEDNLRVVSVNSVSGVEIALQGRMIDSKGTITAARWTHTPLSSRTARTTDFPLGVGAVLNLTVSASAGSPLIGQTYVIVQLVRGMGAAAIVLGTLLAGYVTAKQALAFPGSPIVQSIAEGGCYRQISGTTPALGGEISETVPTGARWFVIAISAVLTTSAAVASRTPNLFFGAGAGDYFGAGQPIVVNASSATAYWWAIGMPLTVQVGQMGSVAGLLADNRMLAGFTFSTRTSNLQAGDQWSPPVYLVQEWLEVD